MTDRTHRVHHGHTENAGFTWDRAQRGWDEIQESFYRFVNQCFRKFVLTLTCTLTRTTQHSAAENEESHKEDGQTT